MPRPRKCRRVCSMPGIQQFGPLDGGENIQTLAMSVEEFEAIRLIDLEGLSQEECAKRMEIARTTAQAIYNSARVKLAECLVKGMSLSIGGGSYVLCNEESSCRACTHCHKKRCCAGDDEEDKYDGNRE